MSKSNAQQVEWCGRDRHLGLDLQICQASVAGVLLAEGDEESLPRYEVVYVFSEVGRELSGFFVC